MIRLPHRGWLFDLDGTVYRGEELIPGADATIAALRAAGRRVVFLSNKPLQTRADYARKLTKLGIPTRLLSPLSHGLDATRARCYKSAHSIAESRSDN